MKKRGKRKFFDGLSVYVDILRNNDTLLALNPTRAAIHNGDELILYLLVKDLICYVPVHISPWQDFTGRYLEQDEHAT